MTRSTSTLAAILANHPPGSDISATGENHNADTRQIHHGVRILAARLLRNIPGDRHGGSGIPDPGNHRRRTPSYAGRLSIAWDARVTNRPSTRYWKGSTHRSKEVRLAAIDALGNFTGTDNVRARLAKCLKIRTRRSGSGWWSELAHYPERRPATCLGRALEDEDPGVCRAALNQLTRQNYSAEAATRVARTDVQVFE